MISFPSLDEAIELHTVLLRRFGGSAGIIDLGLLESALFRPQTGYYDDLIHMAAALMESLIINHPFVDGNKRVAFFLTDIFLRTNGLEIETSPKAGHQFIIKCIAAKKDRIRLIDQWLRKYSNKI